MPIKRSILLGILLLGTWAALAACSSPAADTSVPPTVAPALATTGQPAELVWKITGDPNPFSSPVDVAVDPEGNLYVLEVGNSRVQKFDPNGKSLLMWGSKGSGDGQFHIAQADEGRVAVDAEGNVYVSDVNNYRLQKFDRNGKFLLKWGSEGYGEGQFTTLEDIAIDQQNNVYVLDYGQASVQKFDGNGRFLLRWGAPGSSDGQFDGIHSVAIDGQGNVLVADGTGRLQKFDRNGTFLSKYLLQPLANLAPSYVWLIELDGQGNIYFTDHSNDRIVKLDSNGSLLAAWGSTGAGAGQFNYVSGIAVDKEGDVYASDYANNSVQKFRQRQSNP